MEKGHPNQPPIHGRYGLVVRTCFQKLGFTVAIIPKANMPKAKIPGLRVIPVERIDQAITAAAELN